MKSLMKLIGLVILTITLAFTTVKKRTIVIDVSHGGKDHGADIDGFTEKSIALDIATKIQKLNKKPSTEIILTRDTDKFVSLDERVEFINNLKPDLVISIHVNASENMNARGTEILISDKNKQRGKSGILALEIYYSLQNQTVEIKHADHYLLKKVDYPIAIVELGYLTNEMDRRSLTSEEGQNEIAKALLQALE